MFVLETALEFIAEEFSETFKAVEALSLKKNEITFNLLWTLFLPDMIVCGVGHLGEPVAYKFLSGKEGVDAVGNRFFNLIVTNYDYNGKLIGRTAPKTLTINNFPAARKIASLEYVPLDLHPEAQSLRSLLLERGKMAMKLYKRQVVEYPEGHALREGPFGTLVKFNVSIKSFTDRPVSTSHLDY